MKKVSIIILSLVLCISFCACSNAKTQDNTTTTTVGASIARPTDDTTDTKATTVQDEKGEGTTHADVIKNETTTSTVTKENSTATAPAESTTEQPTDTDNVHINAGDLL